MRIVSRYLVRHVLTILLMAVGIGTFVMLIGLFAKSLSLMAKGVNMSTLLLFLLYKTPELLAYTLPMGLLVATIMVFNRMSADNEVTALRTGGLSLIQVILPLVGLSIATCALSAYLVFQLAPNLNHHARWMIKEFAASSFLDLLEPETYNELGDGAFVYFDRQEGDTLHNLRIFRFAESGSLQEDMSASTGRITLDAAAKTLELHLENVILVTMQPGDADDEDATPRPARLIADYTLIREDYGEDINRSDLMRRTKHMTWSQLLAHIHQVRSVGGDPSRALVEMHTRAVLCLAPFTFMLLGIPLGIRVGRKETYTGLVVALMICVGFFGFLSFVEGLYRRPHLMPQLLVWIPNLMGQAIGLWMIWKRR